MVKKFVYDEKMKDFFVTNGALIVDIDYHKKTGCKYWVFVKNDKLEELYVKWNEKCKKYKK